MGNTASLLRWFLHLALSAAVRTIDSFGTTSLAVLVGITARLIHKWREKESVRWRQWRDIGYGALFTLVAWVAIMGVTMATIVFDDHQRLIADNKGLTEALATTRQELDWRQHNISTTDSVFPNVISTLQAFSAFRHDINGKPCVLYFSAPPETMALATTLAQLSSSVSGCSTFGPIRTNNPGSDEELNIGMIPGAIVIHAANDEKAANDLFNSLGSQIEVARSYRLFRDPKKRWSSPTQNREHLVWLQFGSNVKWNSER